MCRTRSWPDRIRAVASGLIGEGMRPGDRVLFSVRPGWMRWCSHSGSSRPAAWSCFADPGAGATLFRARSALAGPRWVAAESLLYAASTPLLRPFARRRGIDLPDYRTVVPGARHIRAGRWLPGVPRGGAATSGR